MAAACNPCLHSWTVPLACTPVSSRFPFAFRWKCRGKRRAWKISKQHAALLKNKQKIGVFHRAESLKRQHARTLRVAAPASVPGMLTFLWHRSAQASVATCGSPPAATLADLWDLNIMFCAHIGRREGGGYYLRGVLLADHNVCIPVGTAVDATYCHSVCFWSVCLRCHCMGCVREVRGTHVCVGGGGADTQLTIFDTYVPKSARPACTSCTYTTPM